ncbi:DUF3618 domain-containing protein [Rhizobium sp. LjRoot98]|uniref:DUF3618 domain-containing protein n=1 Tax=unclassified Rhizobium TaxID=2613769 RepID=UPI000713696E|nr:DUF3618 domain-containing protein [Rhizobium sp. Root1204]KQV35270.1 nutrient deprivation-induced protein [Rhizobium sp. Root1204]
METNEKTSADLQREIDRDRERIGQRIDAIQERMSPGQLVDEVIAYAKGSGGAEYVNNLGHALKNNPLPVALMGVSLAWLMAKGSTSTEANAAPSQVSDYPLYQANGPVRRLGPPEYEFGSRYSHFSDNSGKRLRALTDEAGRRAGHFVDEAGTTYRGFADASGKQIDHIMDETGAAFDAASGWLSEKWEQTKNTVSSIGTAASDTAHSMSDRASSTASSVRGQTDKLNEMILTQFRDQPLVGGALAFAVGAAIGAALPHTEVEDKLVGDAADSTKEMVSAEARVGMEKTKEMASDLSAKVVDAASTAHDDLRDRVVEEVDALRQGSSDRNTDQA